MRLCSCLFALRFDAPSSVTHFFSFLSCSLSYFPCRTRQLEKELASYKAKREEVLPPAHLTKLCLLAHDLESSEWSACVRPPALRPLT